MESAAVNHEIQLDEGRHSLAKIGYIVLANEETCEDDIFRLTPAGVGAHISRIPASDDVDLDSVQRMKSAVKSSASLLLPDYELDVVCFTCSGGTMVLGEQNVCDLLDEARPNAKAVTVIGCANRALKALGAKKVVVLAPYPEMFESHVKGYLSEAGFDVLVYKSLEIEKNADIGRVTPDYLYQKACEINQEDADAVFICCGALRSLDITEKLEKKLGKPVVTSNQAMVWDCLRQAGVNEKMEGYGELFNL